MLSKEKQVLGVYIRGHPFEQYRPYFKNCSFDCSYLNDYEEDEDGTVTYNNLKSGQAVTMGGIVAAIKKLNTKQGSSMAFITVEDLFGSIECIAFPNVYEKIKSFLAVDVVVALSGKIDISEGEKKVVLLLDNVKEFTPPEAKAAPVPKVTAVNYSSASAGSSVQPSDKPVQNVLWLNASGLDDGEFDELQEMLSAYRGETEVKVLRGTQKFRYPAGITRSKAFEAELRTFLPAECIKFV
jgi:DNA polymerase III alpha subunit